MIDLNTVAYLLKKDVVVVNVRVMADKYSEGLQILVFQTVAYV